MKALSTNRLASSPHYARILHEYNELLATKGRVNNLKFYRENILPVIPTYSIPSWYQFLRRFKSTAGLISAQVVNQAPNTLTAEEENKLQNTLLASDVATKLGIQRALNIGATSLERLMVNPELMTVKDAADLLFKAMKAQDSRIGAVAKIRRDRREETAFQKAFDRASYSDQD